jgi:hypothetical protein
MQRFSSFAAGLHTFFTKKSTKNVFNCTLRKFAPQQYVLLGLQVLTVEVTHGTLSADTPFWTAQLYIQDFANVDLGRTRQWINNKFW